MVQNKYVHGFTVMFAIQWSLFTVRQGIFEGIIFRGLPKLLKFVIFVDNELVCFYFLLLPSLQISSCLQTACFLLPCMIVSGEIIV